MVFGKLLKGLAKTREKISGGLARIFSLGRKLDEETLDELEELLYEADLGLTGTEIVEEIKQAWKKKEISNTEDIKPFLKKLLLSRLEGCEGTLKKAENGPTIILVAGVNGSGKTTSIAKLAKLLKDQGNTVMVACGDTFRAAAVEQLTIWAERIGIPVIKQKTGADPGAVVFDAVDSALARKIDYLIVDTAGRLHTQKNLMAELEKIVRVMKKKIPDAPHETILVLDATTGQNAIRQAEEFSKSIPVTGLFLAKLDGTAKGGAVFGIRKHMNIPVKFIGLGEKLDDIERFNAEEFVDGVLAMEQTS